MKKFGVLFGTFFLAALFVASAAAVDYPEAPDIKTDIVLTTNKRVEGAIARDNCFGITIMVGKNEVKVPHQVIVAAYYQKANNDAYAAGMAAYAAKNWAEALGNFQGATPGDISEDALKKSFMDRVSYLRGVCAYHLGDFALAEKSLKDASRRDDAVYKAEAEYYLARMEEAKGAYDKAQSKYHALTVATYKKMKDDGAAIDKWDYLARLGMGRAKVLALAPKAGQDDNMKKAEEEFQKIFQEGKANEEQFKKTGKGVRFFEDDVLLCDVQVKACALKYLAKKSPDNYQKLVETLNQPLRDAQVANDKSALAWMYLDRADCYFGMMEKESDAAKKKEYGEDALMDYLRVTMIYSLGPVDLARAYYRTGVILEQLQLADWESRALQAYRRATSPTYKATPTYDAAKKAREELEKKTAAKDGKDKK